MEDTCKIAAENFSHNVICLRQQHNISKLKMAKIMGVGVNMLNRIERGELPRCLKASAIFNLSEYFQISTDEALHSKLR